MAEHGRRHVLHLLLLLYSHVLLFTARADLPGTWEVLLQNAGIASMHTAVTRFGTVVLLDRTNIGPSQLPLPPSRCRHVYGPDNCTAHSALFDPVLRRLRPLSILTDTWCSSGQFLPDGQLLQTGGDLNGLKKIRTFSPCNLDRPCDWVELNYTSLAVGRWYATNQILPNGAVIIIGGRAAPSVEFYPSQRLVQFPFLTETQDYQLDNLYPFVHLLPDGLLFVFANSHAVLLDPDSLGVARTLPELPGGPRNYPSAGSSVMLALDSIDNFAKAEILICGGAKYGAFLSMEVDAPAMKSCGRISPTDLVSSWEMEDMPNPRIMGDMVMLPTGEVVIINGAEAGSQGFGLATRPSLNPVLYRPDQPAGLRFMVLNPTAIPRMYHSTANLLPDGRILVAGSNPNYFYKFDDEFPTELRIEAFSPEYLSFDRANIRPAIEVSPEVIRYGEGFELELTVELPLVDLVGVNLASAPFATHSFSQGQRLVRLAVSPPVQVANEGDGGRLRYRVGFTAPPNGKVAPPGFYMAFGVNQGVPSVARWVQLVI